MKKLLFQIIFLLLIIPAFSQGFVTVNGTVTDLANGNPIPNHAVTIMSDSSSGFVYYKVVMTNASGFFADTVIVTMGVTGTLFIQTYDCNNILHQDVWNYTPFQTHTSTFSICNTNGGGCIAAFTFSAGSNNLCQFTDLSSGTSSIIAWSWNFGDSASGSNNFSNLQNPSHIFTLPGTYTVCLTIQSANGCSNTICQTIVMGSSNCHAEFTYYSDTTASNNTFHFIDQSTPGAGYLTTWVWNFGDGQTQTVTFPGNPNVTHTYATGGAYTVCLSIMGSDTTCYDTKCKTVSPGNGGGCHAQYSYSVLLGSSVVSFTDLSFTNSGAIHTWVWDFGDGTQQTVTYPANPNVTHTYAGTALVHIACLTIQGDSACYDQVCDTVFVPGNGGCTANFSYTDSTNASNLVQFFDLSQTSGGAPVSFWVWNFGDPASGINNTSTSQNPTHQFTAAGTYTVCLTIHSADSSCYDNICKTVIVTGTGGCQSNFTFASVPPSFTTVNFTDLSTGNPTAWSWSFGDGTGSTLQNPVHTFAAQGTFTVCLTITGNNCTSSFCQYVVVHDSTNYHQVYGQVFAGNFPLSLGMAMIFSYDTAANYQPFVQVSPIDSMGVYYFTMVPNGSYFILAVPFDSAGYLPTYYGNVTTWQQATLFTLGSANNPYNINLVPASMMTPGQGSASGQINMGDLSSAMLDKINMILQNDQGQAIGFTKVSTAGAFGFPSLAYGTYWLHPEMPGVTSDNIMIVITAAKPHVDVNMTYTGKKITGIGNVPSMVNSWSVYPNPVGDNLTVAVDLKHATDVSVGVFNMAGQIVYSSAVKLHDGVNHLEISTSALPAGIYSLRINSAAGLNLSTKVVKIK